MTKLKLKIMKKLALIVICTSCFYLAKAVPFKLVNTGITKIYLEIPGVMNPNLSPLSYSGVGLEVGQKIFYYRKGTQYTLLTVDEGLTGQSVNVRKLIRKQRKN